LDDDRTHGNRATEPDADDAWLDRLLAEDAQRTRDHYIADAGFSARVIAELPPPAALPAWRKPVVIGLWATASVGLALALPSVVLDVGREAYRLLAAQPMSLSGLGGAVLAMGILTWAGAAYALRSND
jgi:hypothetical protein